MKPMTYNIVTGAQYVQDRTRTNSGVLVSQWSRLLSYHDCPLPQICLLRFFILVASKVISVYAPTCCSMDSGQLYSAAPLGEHTAFTTTQFPTQSHYPNTDQPVISLS